MKIYAPVKDTNGIYASVVFVNGVGETDKPHLIQWFKNKGFKVEDQKVEPTPAPPVQVIEEVEEVEETEPDFDNMTPNELRDWMKANGLGMQMKNIRNKEKLLEIIRG